MRSQAVARLGRLVILNVVDREGVTGVIVEQNYLITWESFLT